MYIYTGRFNVASFPKQYFMQNENMNWESSGFIFRLAWAVRVDTWAPAVEFERGGLKVTGEHFYIHALFVFTSLAIDVLFLSGGSLA